MDIEKLLSELEALELEASEELEELENDEYIEEVSIYSEN